MPKVVIDVERCKGCELCVHYCPPKVMAMSRTLNGRGFYPVMLIDEERCTSCGACAIVCPDWAITVYKAERVAVR
ncbi:MAG TPA: 4Fe-4S binding protein [bacterium]|nr:4Fe-4S binding protein [bacterium]